MRPVEALRRHLELGSTGALFSSGCGGAGVSVFLMQGEILAAESPDDGRDLVLRLRNGGHLDIERARAIEERLLHAPQIGDVLFGTLSDDIVMAHYAARFRENLARFLAGEGEAEFAPREDVQIENVQVGHDSGELLAELAGAVASLEPLLARRDTLRLERGPVSRATSQERVLLERLPDDGRLSALLDASPWEECETLQLVAGLLEKGGLRRCAPEPGEPPEGQVVALDPGQPDLIEPEDGYREPVVVEEAEGEDEMSMFRDHDHRRRHGEGVFTVARELLDTVDLSGLGFLVGQGEIEDQILEMEDGDRVDAASGAVNLCFTSPPLKPGEAQRKIDVTNEVLRQICAALDEEHGSGSGQAAVQLLIESVSPDLAALLQGVDASREGQLDAGRLCANLEQRAESERRRVLNAALRDLVERGFTMTVEQISEARFEEMLQRIAGFQQRLGL